MTIDTDSVTEYHAVCIAKDEAAYLHEWVFHHLHFGFDKLFIYLNRITDESISVMQQINGCYPNVYFEVIDWIDWCQPSVKKNIQDIVYSYHFSKSRKMCADIYTLFIDVDELWTPADFKSSIAQEHVAIGKPRMVSYEWLLESGNNKPFSGFQAVLNYRESNFVKTLYKNTLTPNLFSANKAKIKGGYKGTLADGKRYVALDDRRQGRVAPDHSGLKRSFVIHRIMKSEIEYLCSLVRSNPDSDLSIKMNRNGYIGQDQANDVINFDKVLVEDYAKLLSEFTKECGLVDLVADSRAKFAFQKYILLKKIYLLGKDHDTKILKVFRNVSDSDIILLKKYILDRDRVRASRKRPLFQYLRDIAISAEKHDLEVARFFMSEACKLNPNGPLINKKISHYEEILND